MRRCPYVSRWSHGLCVFCVCEHIHWTSFSSNNCNRGRRSLAASHILSSYARRDYSSDWKRCCNSGKETWPMDSLDWSSSFDWSIRNLQKNVGNLSEFGKESRWPSIDIMIAHYIGTERTLEQIGHRKSTPQRTTVIDIVTLCIISREKSMCKVDLNISFSGA